MNVLAALAHANAEVLEAQRAERSVEEEPAAAPPGEEAAAAPPGEEPAAAPPGEEPAACEAAGTARGPTRQPEVERAAPPRAGPTPPARRGA